MKALHPPHDSIKVGMQLRCYGMTLFEAESLKIIDTNLSMALKLYFKLITVLHSQAATFCNHFYMVIQVRLSVSDWLNSVSPSHF